MLALLNLGFSNSQLPEHDHMQLFIVSLRYLSMHTTLKNSFEQPSNARKVMQEMTRNRGYIQQMYGTLRQITRLTMRWKEQQQPAASR